MNKYQRDASDTKVMEKTLGHEQADARKTQHLPFVSCSGALYRQSDHNNSAGYVAVFGMDGWMDVWILLC